MEHGEWIRIRIDNNERKKWFVYYSYFFRFRDNIDEVLYYFLDDVGDTMFYYGTSSDIQRMLGF